MRRPTSVSRAWRRLRDARGGATAVEGAIAFGVLVPLTLGMLELGLLFYEYHRFGEATRSAARTFEIDPVISSFATLPITCPGGAGCDESKITKAIESIKGLVPGFAKGNLEVVYDASGVDTDSATVTPTVTVNFIELKYKLLFLNVFFGFDSTFTFPTFSTTRLMATNTTS